jgi:A/G-specific adenine glycosylase
MGHARGIQDRLPVKAAQRLRPLKRGAAFVVQNAKDEVLLVRRPENGLLGGMLQPPLGPWTDEFPSAKEAALQAPFAAPWKKRVGVVKHGFTHFELEIEVYTATPRAPRKPQDSKWIRRDALASAALPTLMRKILAHGLDDGGPLFAQVRSARRR